MQPSFIRMPKMSSHIFIKYICGYKEKRRKIKKQLAFFWKLLYNITCVREWPDGNTKDARLAQLAEHLTLNQGVQGSNP